MDHKSDLTPYTPAPKPVGKRAARQDRPPADLGLPDPERIMAEISGKRPKDIRRSWLKLSFLFCILVPTLLAGAYYTFIAADQYAVEVRFSIRGANTGKTPDLIGMFTGSPSSGSTVTDSYIVMDYIYSREILDKLQSRVNIKNIYRHDNADFFSRLPADVTAEGLLDYWKKMISLSFDSSSQIITAEVRAFSAEDAKNVATAVITLGEELINGLSARARNDAVNFANQEVARAEKRLRDDRLGLARFRDVQQELDPEKKAAAQMTLLAKLEGELTRAKTQLLTIRPTMAPDSPRIIFLQRRIDGLNRQVKDQRSKLGQGDQSQPGQKALSGLLSDYERLIVAREFSEKAYLSALASLEGARAEAARQQRYLTTFVKPSLPQEALYPRRLLNILLVLGISIIVWALGVLVVYAVRDHVH